MSEQKSDESWAVMYRNDEGILKVIECFSEREARAKAAKLDGTYQKIEG